MMDLSLRDLDYVATIARERNITRAAAALHMAQPALSQSLQRIERRLGVRLFDRTSRQVAPTAAGEVLAAAATRILGDVRRAVEQTRTAGGLPQVLRIHVSEPSLLTPRRVLAAARANVPEAAIHQTTLPREDVAAQLITGALDLAVAGRFRGEGLRSMLVREERIGVLVGADHPLAAEVEVAPTALAPYRLLSIDTTMSSWDTWVTDYLAHFGLEPRWTKEVVFGLSTGSDVLSDQQTVLLTLESVSRDYLEGLVWRPMTPVRMVPWFLTYREESAASNATVATVLRVVERLAVDQGWRA